MTSALSVSSQNQTVPIISQTLTNTIRKYQSIYPHAVRALGKINEAKGFNDFIYECLKNEPMNIEASEAMLQDRYKTYLSLVVAKQKIEELSETFKATIAECTRPKVDTADKKTMEAIRVPVEPIEQVETLLEKMLPPLHSLAMRVNTLSACIKIRLEKYETSLGYVNYSAKQGSFFSTAHTHFRAGLDRYSAEKEKIIPINSSQDGSQTESVSTNQSIKAAEIQTQLAVIEEVKSLETALQLLKKLAAQDPVKPTPIEEVKDLDSLSISVLEPKVSSIKESPLSITQLTAATAPKSNSQTEQGAQKKSQPVNDKSRR